MLLLSPLPLARNPVEILRGAVMLRVCMGRLIRASDALYHRTRAIGGRKSPLTHGVTQGLGGDICVYEMI